MMDPSEQMEGYNLTDTIWMDGYNLMDKCVSKLYFNLYLYLGYNLYIGFPVFWIQFDG